KSLLSRGYVETSMLPRVCRPHQGTFTVADTRILVLPLNHPQGCFGYRIMQNGKTISYCTDVEHGLEWRDKNIMTLAKDSDFFIVDAQYTPQELADHTK